MNAFKKHIFHSSKMWLEDKNIIYLATCVTGLKKNIQNKAIRYQKISATIVGWTASGNFNR